MFIAIEVDHHRLQDALLAAMNGADDPRAWRGEIHAGRLLIGEQYLTELDPVADLNLHGRFHPVIIEAYDGDTAYRPRGLYTLRRRTWYGQIEPMFYFDHRFA